MPLRKRAVALTINGREVEALIEPRKLLADFIREDAGLTGTHVGCEHGVCGACTVLINGRTERSCLAFAVQAQGRDIRTVEAWPPAKTFRRCKWRFWQETWAAMLASARRAS